MTNNEESFKFLPSFDAIRVLLTVNINLVTVLQTQIVQSVLRINTTTITHESGVERVEINLLLENNHKFPHGSCLLDLNCSAIWSPDRT